MATKNSINTNDPIEVADGGTGVSSVTAFSVICGGTTSTGPLQSADTGISNSGRVLTSTGSSSLPTWQAAPSTGSMVLIETLTASASSSLDFTSDISSTYANYLLHIDDLLVATDGASLHLTISTGGVFQGGTAYTSGVNSVAFNSTTVSNNNVNGGSEWNITPALDTSGSFGAFVKLWIFNATTGSKPSITGQETVWRNSDSTNSYASVVGYYSSDITVDGFRIAASSGNLTSGTASLYGIKD